jgi:DNA-binding NarL/FixJ family response regulator
VAGPTGQIQVVIADDHPIVRDGLSALLGLLPDVGVVGTAVDGEDAVKVVLRARPDVVLMDLRMPGSQELSQGQHSRVRPAGFPFRESS